MSNNHSFGLSTMLYKYLHHAAYLITKLYYKIDYDFSRVMTCFYLHTSSTTSTTELDIRKCPKLSKRHSKALAQSLLTVLFTALSIELGIRSSVNAYSRKHFLNGFQEASVTNSPQQQMKLWHTFKVFVLSGVINNL